MDTSNAVWTTPPKTFRQKNKNLQLNVQKKVIKKEHFRKKNCLGCSYWQVECSFENAARKVPTKKRKHFAQSPKVTNDKKIVFEKKTPKIFLKFFLRISRMDF